MKTSMTAFRGMAALLFITFSAADVCAGHSAVFGGGPLYTYAANHRDLIRESGFTTVILWTIHVHDDGDLVLNDHKIVDNGVYVGRAAWPAEVAAFKTGATSVNRIEIGIGSWGVPDFEKMKALIDAQGTGPGSILYKNFLALRNALPSIDAVNYDDESCYDVPSSVALGIMLRDLGFKVALCPYTYPGYWIGVFNGINSARPGTVDRVYLQCYAGGANNNPGTWNGYFGGLKVSPGLWCYPHGSTPAQVETRMSKWRGSHAIAGGFMWLFDDMLSNQGSYPVKAYAHAINDALAFNTHSNEVVTLFQDINFGGWLADFAPGVYTSADIVAAGGRDNDASSLIVKPGYKVTFYDGDNLQGAALVKTATDSSTVDDGWNDRVSSMIIEPVDDPVLYCTFNAQGGSVAEDSSGLNRDGILLNMDDSAWTMGKQCRGLSFDGFDDHVTYSDFRGVGGGLDRTCSAWVKTGAASADIISWGSTVPGSKWIIRTDETGALRTEIQGGYISGKTPVNDGQWHHVAVVFANDGTPDIADVILYVDGRRDEIEEVLPYAMNTAELRDVSIGLFSTRYFAGRMDEVRVYARALDDSEILDIYETDALTADIAADGRVNLSDFADLAASWNAVSAGAADLTCDGTVDTDDLAILIEEWLNAI